MVEMHLFGSPSYQNIKAVQNAGFHSDNIYLAILDRSALWDPAVLEVILRDFPLQVLPENDLYLILVECVANAALHGNAETLGFYARRREDIFLLSFFQIPPMAEVVTKVLSMALQGKLPDYTCDLPGGLGIPILLRLAEKVTISGDRAKLHLWFRLKSERLFKPLLLKKKTFSLTRTLDNRKKQNTNFNKFSAIVRR